ncbi:hypothetical protein [Streptomyces tsukubensis]|uniref:hypothetical protein n=1 Tax=Streptomyces tsukubensis TaxID=83656 RepID=UPI0034508E8B
MTIDPDTIPATPVYTVTVTAAGEALLDGEQVSPPTGDPGAARLAALAEVRIKAAYHGRPVRVTAKEADGSAWPLLVAPDGTVQTLDQPHPAPRPPAAPEPGPRSAPADPPPVPAPRAATAAPDASAWSAPPPPTVEPLFRHLVAQERAGDFAAAVVTADQLERTLAAMHGPEHPLTVQALTVRAWLTTRASVAAVDLPELIELLVETARRRQQSGAPAEDTERLVRNVHAAWRRLAASDPAYAREIAGQVMELLGQDQERARDVLRWIERGAAA